MRRASVPDFQNPLLSGAYLSWPLMRAGVPQNAHGVWDPVHHLHADA